MPKKKPSKKKKPTVSHDDVATQEKVAAELMAFAQLVNDRNFEAEFDRALAGILAAVGKKVVVKR